MQTAFGDLRLEKSQHFKLLQVLYFFQTSVRDQSVPKLQHLKRGQLGDRLNVVVVRVGVIQDDLDDGRQIKQHRKSRGVHPAVRQIDFQRPCERID